MAKDRFTAAAYNALVALHTTTSINGDPAGAWIVCSELIGHVDIFTNKQILIPSGPDSGDLTDITAFNPATGRIDVSPSFRIQITRGTDVLVLNQSAASPLTSKSTIVTATKTALWNSGIATSGNPGADLVTVGIPGQWSKVTDCWLVLTGFDITATLTITGYQLVAGVMRTFGPITWGVAGQDLALLDWFWGWGNNELFGVKRYEVASDRAADDNFTATYEYKIKSW